MGTPYTYRITHLPSGKHYYGSRYAKNCHPSDLWVKYFTSSKTVKKLIEQDGKEAFFVEIRKVFDDKKSRVEWERKVLVRLGVPRNPNWFNRYSGVSLTPDEMKVAMLQKYGVDHNAKLPESRAKFRATCMNRYGVDNPSKSPEVIEKIAEKFNQSLSRRELVTCPKCGTSSKSSANMKRYHFDNCKHYLVDEMHLNGLSPSEISDATGLVRHALGRYIKKKFGKINKLANTGRLKKSGFQVEYLGVLYRSKRELARVLGRSKQYVNFLVKRGEATIVNT